MRFYLPPHAWNDAQLDEAESHHAERVLRLRPGSIITVFDGKGRQASATIESFHKKNTSQRLAAPQQTSPPAVTITLAQAIPKGRNIDFIIQKAVELGATRIIPLVTDRTIVRFNDAEAATKQERWQAIALEACKQCGQNWMPIVERPCSLQESLKIADDLRLIASLEKEALPIKNFFEQRRNTIPIRNIAATIFVGPEGDFTAEEYLLTRTSGCQPVSLGPIVLRTETAALYCLSVLSYQLL